jgi:predicted nucleic acid-binding protein
VTLVDTNVLLDLVTNDPDWSGWSIAQLEEAALKGPLCINDVVYAELSVRYARIEDLEAMLDDAAIEVARTPRVGAHAAVSGLPLLTRDGGRYRTYFPSMALIAPEKAA